MKDKTKGISLIVLIITIIVIIILAGAVILSLSQNNPINSGNEAVFKSDLKTFESDLTMYLTEKYVSTVGSYNPENLKADDLTAEYGGVIIPGVTIKDIIPVLSTTNKYNGQLEIVNGRLVYKGTDIPKKRWAEEINLEVVNGDRLNAIISTVINLPISAGTDAVCTIKISSNSSINSINLGGNLELLDVNSVPVTVQPVFTIGTPTGNNTDTLRNVDITINTTTLVEGTYILKLKARCISNIYGITNETDVETGVLFEIDNTPPTNPGVSVSPTGWTNGNVTVTIDYSLGDILKEYSMDAVTWSSYTAPIIVTTNNTTIYARAIDTAGNQSGQTTITIANIDKQLPTVLFTSNGGINLQSASTIVISSDLGGSNINSSTLQYVWDTQNITIPSSGWTVFTNEDNIIKSSITETYYLWIKAIDNAGNSVTAKSNAFVADNTAPANPTISVNPAGWTNGNVTVTITYPGDAAIKEYSTNGTTWSPYTSGIVVTTNNTTIYAKAIDASGNQSGQSTITVASIDRVIPTVSATYKKADVTAYTSDVWTNQSVTITANGNDGSGSGINRYQITYNGSDFYDLSGNTITMSTSGRTGVWVRAIDNVGNIGSISTTYLVAIDKTVPIITLSQTLTKEYTKTITTNIYDSESGILIKKWAKGSQSIEYFSGSGTVFTGTTFNVNENATYTVYTKNNAGSETINTIIVTNTLFLKTYTGTSGLAYTNGATCDGNGIITLPAVLDGIVAIQYGPYQTLEAGTYQISITGVNLNLGQLSTYYGWGTPEGGTLISRNLITNTATSIVYSISLPETRINFESVIHNYSSYIIKVNSIEIKQTL